MVLIFFYKIIAVWIKKDKKNAALRQPFYYGDNRIRTDDPLIANQMLYQLSYIPERVTIIQYIKKNFNLKSAEKCRT